MNSDSLMHVLTDYGALGLFAGFLIWQFIGLQRRLDKLVENFQTQLADINKDYDERIEKMRERYDIVIEQYRKEGADAQKDFARIRESVQTDITHKIEQLGEKLDTILREVSR